MRTVIQRVKKASVRIKAENYIDEIGEGLLVLAAFEDGDTDADLEWMSKKICAMRIFDDEDGVMNLSVSDTGRNVMVVSQFTLYASTAKGNRPSYIKAAKPEISIPLYEKFLKMMEDKMGRRIAHGHFGADMQIALVNDGPVTIVVDSKLKF